MVLDIGRDEIDPMAVVFLEYECTSQVHSASLVSCLSLLEKVAFKGLLYAR